MQCMGLAELAVFLCLHSVRMSLLILRRIVITLLAFGASQCDFDTHILYLQIFSQSIFQSIKKKPLLPVAFLL